MAHIRFSQGFDGDKTYDVDDCCRKFLLTYSQAYLMRFPLPRDFEDCVIAAIRSSESKRELLEWAVCLENHQEGVITTICLLNLMAPGDGSQFGQRYTAHSEYRLTLEKSSMDRRST